MSFASREAIKRALRSFLTSFAKQARNREGRDVCGTLDREIEDLHERFLLTPADKPWGDPSLIWPEQAPGLRA